MDLGDGQAHLRVGQSFDVVIGHGVGSILIHIVIDDRDIAGLSILALQPSRGYLGSDYSG